MDDFIAKLSSMTEYQLREEAKRILTYYRNKSKTNTFDQNIEMNKKSAPVFSSLISEFDKRNMSSQYEEIRRYVNR